jgi:hypothetical protein
LAADFDARLLWRALGLGIFVACILWLTQDVEVSLKFVARNIGLFLFAAGCIFYGAFAYSRIASPVWALLILCLVISRRIADSDSAISESIRKALAPFSAGFTAALGLLLLFTILTPGNAAVRFFEACFAVWYRPLDDALEPGFIIMIPVWILVLYLRQRFQRLPWLAMYKKVTGFASQTAIVLTCVATFLFTGGHVVQDHAWKYGMQINRDFHKEAVRLARAKQQQKLGRQMIESLRKSSDKTRQGIMAFAKSARGEDRRSDLTGWVAGEMAAKTESLPAETVPEVLRKPATSRTILEDQRAAAADENRQADAAENSAAVIAVDAASMLLPGDGLLAKFFKDLFSDLAEHGATEINASSLTKVRWDLPIERITTDRAPSSRINRGLDLIKERLREAIRVDGTEEAP